MKEYNLQNKKMGNTIKIKGIRTRTEILSAEDCIYSFIYWKII